LSPQAEIIARRVAKSANDALLEAINARVGGDDWQYHEVADRLERTVCAGVENIYFDGMLILRLHPVRLDVTDDGRMLTASRSIERFQPKIGEAVH
jgi:hypothetical protein